MYYDYGKEFDPPLEQARAIVSARLFKLNSQQRFQTIGILRDALADVTSLFESMKAERDRVQQRRSELAPWDESAPDFEDNLDALERDTENLLERA